MKKAAFIFALFLAAALSSRGQFYYGGLSGSFFLPRTEFITDSTGKLLLKPGDMGFSLQAGGGVGTLGKGNTWYSTFVAPSFAYNLSSRFRLKAGISFNQLYGDYFYPEAGSPFAPGALSSTSLFVQGDYLLNNKIMLSGAVYKEFFPFNPMVSDPRLKTEGAEGVMFNLNYRPTPGFEINVGIDYSRGYHPFRPNPFHQPGLFSPGFPFGY